MEPPNERLLQQTDWRRQQKDASISQEVQHLCSNPTINRSPNETPGMVPPLCQNTPNDKCHIAMPPQEAHSITTVAELVKLTRKWMKCPTMDQRAHTIVQLHMPWLLRRQNKGMPQPPCLHRRSPEAHTQLCPKIQPPRDRGTQPISLSNALKESQEHHSKTVQLGDPQPYNDLQR